jgi:cbb3-type cytochrome oxidase subunit 3
MVHHPDDDDDDFEFELEDVDPEILEHAKRRGERQIHETEVRAAHLETFEEPSESDPITFEDFEGFRFTTRHLLIATALMAVFMSMVRRGWGCNALFISFIAAIAYGWWFVLRKERRERLERERRRAEASERLAQLQTGDKSADSLSGRGVTYDEEEFVPEKPSFSFSFSLKQMMIVFAIAAVMLGLASILGTETAALILGIVAVIGLVVLIMGFELPGIIVFGWWVLIGLYVVMSVAAVIMGRGNEVP